MRTLAVIKKHSEMNVYLVVDFAFCPEALLLELVASFDCNKRLSFSFLALVAFAVLSLSIHSETSSDDAWRAVKSLV